MPTLDPHGYQAVVKDLVWAGGILLFCFACGTFLVMAPAQQEAIRLALSSVPLKPPEQFSALAVLSVVLSVVLVGFFKVHELYDRYALKWRERYDLDFIVPTLVRPFANRLDSSFAPVARDHRREVMNDLFYHFVRDGNPLIAENFVVRFYVRILRFWITCLVEVAVVVFLACALILSLLAFASSEGISTAVGGLGVGLLLGGINRWLNMKSLESVKRATSEEIDEIHRACLPELERALGALHLKLGFHFADAALPT
jgi:hypothetical protein